MSFRRRVRSEGQHLCRAGRYTGGGRWVMILNRYLAWFFSWLIGLVGLLFCLLADFGWNMGTLLFYTTATSCLPSFVIVDYLNQQTRELISARNAVNTSTTTNT